MKQRARTPTHPYHHHHTRGRSAKHEGYDGASLKRVVQSSMSNACRQAAARPSRTAMVSGMDGESGAVSASELPPGFHYWCTDEDYSEIDHCIKYGYTETVDSWSLGIILVRGIGVGGGEGAGLASRVAIRRSIIAGGWRFRVWGDQPHTTGRIGPHPPGMRPHTPSPRCR